MKTDLEKIKYLMEHLSYKTVVSTKDNEIEMLLYEWRGEYAGSVYFDLEGTLVRVEEG